MSTLIRWLQDRHSDFRTPLPPDSSLPALYADLAAHRNSNRSAFDASVAWWKRLLSEACMAGVLPLRESASANAKGADDNQTTRSNGDRLVVRIDDGLLNMLTLDEVGRPLGLGTVVMDLRDRSSFVSLSTFLSSSAPLQGPSTSSQTLSRRAAALALSPLVWAMSQLSVSLGLGEQDRDASEEDWRKAKGDWVIWDNVEALSEAVLSVHRAAPRLTSLDNLFSTHTFRQKILVPALSSVLTASRDGSTSEAVSPNISDRDVQVLLKHLSRDRRVAVVQGDVIKMEQEPGQEMQAASISEHERGIVHVRDTHDKLETQIDELERRIQERQKRLERSIKEGGSKAQSLSYLRSRKALEALRDRRVGTLETLHAVLLKIEQAASDVEVMKAYEQSTASLKYLLRDERLQPDRIDASMDAMQDTLANADEVRQAVEAGQDDMRRAAGVADVEEDEMEAELAALQKEVEGERKAAAEADSTTKKQEGVENQVPVQAVDAKQTQAESAKTSEGRKEESQAAREGEKEPIPAS